jgi:hypothetical protein
VRNRHNHARWPSYAAITTLRAKGESEARPRIRRRSAPAAFGGEVLLSAAIGRRRRKVRESTVDRVGIVQHGATFRIRFHLPEERLEATGCGIIINISHPFFSFLPDRLGGLWLSIPTLSDMRLVVSTSFFFASRPTHRCLGTETCLPKQDLLNDNENKSEKGNRRLLGRSYLLLFKCSTINGRQDDTGGDVWSRRLALSSHPLILTASRHHAAFSSCHRDASSPVIAPPLGEGWMRNGG